jgi:hypothetical protein
MRDVQRVVVIGGLLLLALVALFPPRKGFEPSNLRGSFPFQVASRKFLFSGEIYQYVYTVQGGDRGIAAEVDPGRLIAEALLVVSLTGIVFVIVSGRARSA